MAGTTIIHAIRSAITTAATSSPWAASPTASAPDTRSTMFGSCRPMSRNSSELSTNEVARQKDSVCRRVPAPVRSSERWPTISPAVTTASTPDTPSSSAGT